MHIPTPQEIEALHRKYAPSDEVYNLVYTHSKIINDITSQLIAVSNLSVDSDYMYAASMLHDIGVYPLFNANGSLRADVKYITHGIVGESILKKEGFSGSLQRIASHHTGVGLSKRDVVDQKLPLPVADYLAETDEELLVMYADKFHSKTTPPYFNSFEWYKKDVSRFGEDKPIKFEEMRLKFGMPDLDVLSKKYGFEIR